MPYCTTPMNIELYYEVSGPEDGEPLMLVHGLGAQMIAWYPGFVEMLEGAGFRVIRFDNRDVGLSSKLDHAPDYSLLDMAADVTHLMDHLGLSSAHIAGQSMGGMIAQQVALSFPARVRSLNIIYSAPDATFRLHDPAIEAVRSRRPSEDRDDRVRHYIEQERISGLEGFDEAWIQAFAESVIDRSYCPEGQARQSAAIAKASPRLEDLRKLSMPVAVLHGRSDPLLSFEGSIAMARFIDEAELCIFAGMKHQLPPRLWPDFTAIISRTAIRAGAKLIAPAHVR